MALIVLIVIPLISLSSHTILYIFPHANLDNTDLFLEPVISLKAVMESSLKADQESRKRIQQQIHLYCQTGSADQSRKQLESQHSQWNHVLHQYEFQLGQLLAKSVTKDDLPFLTEMQETVKSLRISRQNAIKEFWLQVFEKNQDSPAECIQSTTKLLQDTLPDHSKPIYLAQYRLWKQIPLLQRKKIIRILSSSSPKSFR